MQIQVYRFLPEDDAAAKLSNGMRIVCELVDEMGARLSMRLRDLLRSAAMIAGLIA